ncbi:MAG: type II toxin-antitoxin system YafQ family toxin [Dehalococcoidia bacterium]
MRTFSRTSQFKKDVKRIKKRGKDISKLKEMLETIASGKELESRYRNHMLIGQYASVRECHVEPDWLLLYKLSESEVVLMRTGTHADLFE